MCNWKLVKCLLNFISSTFFLIKWEETNMLWAVTAKSHKVHILHAIMPAVLCSSWMYVSIMYCREALFSLSSVTEIFVLTFFFSHDYCLAKKWYTELSSASWNCFLRAAKVNLETMNVQAATSTLFPCKCCSVLPRCLSKQCIYNFPQCLLFCLKSFIIFIVHSFITTNSMNNFLSRDAWVFHSSAFLLC